MVNTARKLMVVTQFVTSDGTASGDLKEIRRLYVQDGKVIQNSQSTVSGVTGNSITDAYGAAEKSAFSGSDASGASHGGLKGLGDALGCGMVLAFSITDDFEENMLWLDSNYPPYMDGSAPGVSRGPCSSDDAETPLSLDWLYEDTMVTFSNVRYGDLGSTFVATG